MKITKLTNDIEERRKIQSEKKYRYNVLVEDNEDEEEEESDNTKYKVEKVNIKKQEHHEIYDVNEILIGDFD